MSQKKPQKKYLTTVITALITVMISASPVLAYELPSVSTTYQSRNEVMAESDGTLWFTNEPLFPEDERLFKYIDMYFIVQNGEITIFSNLEQNAPRKVCSHNYKSGNIKTHKKGQNGRCTVTIHKGKKCSKCGKKILNQLISTQTYVKCPH